MPTIYVRGVDIHFIYRLTLVLHPAMVLSAVGDPTGFSVIRVWGNLSTFFGAVIVTAIAARCEIEGALCVGVLHVLSALGIFVEKDLRRWGWSGVLCMLCISSGGLYWWVESYRLVGGEGGGYVRMLWEAKAMYL
jgi:hypothetical protein